MSIILPPKLFLVDDDALFLKALEIEFKQHSNFIIETFSTGELCIQKLHESPDFIILDYHLDDIQKSAMNGIQTLDEIKKSKPNIPVIMLSAQDRIEVAVDCMHHKASDYVIKSETSFIRLQKIISDLNAFINMKSQLDWYMSKV
jgi:DNA-binding NarL/FixJ family response regulator